MVSRAEAARINGKKGGRPEGAINIRSRRTAAHRASTGTAPLDVMLANMDFWRDTANDFLPRLQELFASEQSAEVRITILETINKFLNARDMAQKCAVEAAPYCHPRLAAITLDDPKGAGLKIAGGLPAPTDEPIDITAEAVEVKGGAETQTVEP